MALTDDRRYLALAALAVATAAAGLGYALGPVGLIVAAAVALTWALASPVYAFGAGQLLFAVLATGLADGRPTTALVVGQLGLVAPLLAALLGRWPLRVAATASATFALAAATFGAVYALETTLQGIAVLALVYAIAAYGLHRYELVRLGLVQGADR